MRDKPHGLCECIYSVVVWIHVVSLAYSLMRFFLSFVVYVLRSMWTATSCGL